MKHKYLKRLIAAVSAAAMLTGCLAQGITASAAEGDGMVRSFLTGKLVPESIGRKRAIAVMLSNSIEANPQSGIGNASIVYEAPVEGGYTRFMGIFEDYQDVERIGSVRSSREYYVIFAREFDAFYLHYGQAWYALDLLRSEDTYNISGLSSENDAGRGEEEYVYYRSDDAEAPHNVFTNYDMVQAGIDFLNYPREYSDWYLEQGGHYQFAADDAPVTLDNGQDAGRVNVGYGYNNAYFVFDESTGKYLRYQFDEPHIDRTTGKQLAYDNVILQYCDWKKQPDSDTYLDIDVVTGGNGKFITNGKAIDITWSKDGGSWEDQFAPGNFTPTKYYDESGNEITLNQGKTWICIVLDSESENVQISAE